MPGLGTLVNLGAIIVGTLGGMLFSKTLNEQRRTLATRAIGLCVVIIGLYGALNALTTLSREGGALGRYASLVMVGALVVGTLIGNVIHIESGLESLGERIKKWLGPRAQESTFVEGFLTASLVFAVGAMGILGAVQDGLGNPSTLYLKAVLDGFTALFLSSTLGVGVGFSALSVGVVEGFFLGLTLLVGAVIPSAAVTMLELVGGVTIAAIGCNLYGLKRIPVGDMLPALALALVAGWIM